MKFLSFKKCSVLVVLSVLSFHNYAGVAVVVNPANANALSDKDISRVYLGKKKTFASGGAIQALQPKEGDASRSSFVTGLLKKTERQYKAYWAKLLFTGKGKPPQELGSSAAVKAEVAANADAIGFINSADVDDSVKVVYELP